MRIAYTNAIDAVAASSVTALTVVTGYEASNLQDQRLSTTWRSTALTAQTIIIDLGTAQSITTAAIINHNITAAASTITVMACTTSTFAGATTQTFAYSANMILKFFTAEVYRWWKFTIDDQTNHDGYLEVGRVWLGNYIDINPSSMLEFTVAKKRNDRVVHGRGQQKFASVGVGWREFKLTFPPSETAMVDSILTMYDTVGNHSSVIFCNFDSIRDYTIVEPCYCSISNEMDFQHTERQKYTYALNLVEEK